jgi:hypothetical protein
MGVGVLMGPESAGMDRASTAASKEELGGVGVHVELIVRGDYFESVVDDILAENGGPGLFVGITEPTEPGVDAWL